MSMTVYMDSAASTPIAEEVWTYMMSLKDVYGNPGCNHAMGREAQEIIENAREVIAKRINTEPEEIIFTSGGTEANNLAILGFVQANGGWRNRIITTVAEHISVLEPMEHLVDCGYDVCFLPVDNAGKVDIDRLEYELYWRTSLMSVIFANNELGSVNDIARISEIAKRRGVALHTDAVAALPHLEIDVKTLDIDMMSLSAHKLGGPKGIGALYVSKKISVNPLIYGGDEEMSLRGGTPNTQAIAGFGKAVEILEHSDTVMELTNVLEKGILERIPCARVNNPVRSIPILNVCFLGVDGRKLIQELSDANIFASQGSCSNRDVSHTLQAIGLSRTEANSSIRFSLSKYTTTEEIEHTIETLAELISPA